MDLHSFGQATLVKNANHATKGFCNRREAQAYKTQVLAELQKGVFVEPAKLTLAEFAEGCLGSVKLSLSPEHGNDTNSTCGFGYIVKRIGSLLTNTGGHQTGTKSAEKEKPES